MILADENIPFSIVESLREKGIDVLSIYETHGGLTDKQIIELSKKQCRKNLYPGPKGRIFSTFRVF